MTLGNDNGTDGQTDRQSATHYAAPPREEGRIIIISIADCWYRYYNATYFVKSRGFKKSDV